MHNPRLRKHKALSLPVWATKIAHLTSPPKTPHNDASNIRTSRGRLGKSGIMTLCRYDNGARTPTLLHRAQTHARARTHKHTHTRTRAHTHTHIHTHARTHRTHAHTHTHTHTEGGRDRQTEPETERDRDRETETDRD